jgi:uncharacterized protein (TIGR00369 family)
MVHGGLLSAILDECLAWACAVEKKAFCVTGEIQVRFKSPARLGETLQIAAWAVNSWGPYVRAEGEVLTPEGNLVASATGTFASLSREESAAMQAALCLRPGDIDVLADDVATHSHANPLPPGTGKH